MPLLDKIKDHSAVIGVIGLGYVGLPLAVLQTQKEFLVIGMDEDQNKVDQVNKGKSYISDVSDEDLAQAIGSKRLTALTNLNLIEKCDIILICVPTPLTINKEPDISAIIRVTHAIAQHAHPDMLIVLESTSYPGTTEEVIAPALMRQNFEIGKDLFVAFSPERVDPGNHLFKTHNTFKLVGGFTPACCAIAQTFYEQSITKIFPTSSTKVAEMTKVFENVFRSVNIALVNELALLCDRMNINVFEVIDAAATKNFGFMPFYPGPGVGGHCIPLDPYYLAWKSKEYDLHTRFISLAGEINEGMPYFVLAKLQRILNQGGKCLNGANIVALGVTYKANTGDPRQSPATKVIELLQKEKAQVTYVDPYTPTFKVGDIVYHAKKLTPSLLSKSDCALILTAHSQFDYEMIVEHAPLVFDTRNGTRLVGKKRDNTILL
ncbi:MAG: nucleotide sugar dehydrogenase [Nitrospirota bacterium]|nr:nucleotide sugar dehydrogenase [Nitrospirota bacterium]